MGHLDGMQEGKKAAATEGEDSGGAAALLIARFSRGLGLGCLPPSKLAQGSDCFTCAEQEQSKLWASIQHRTTEDPGQFL